LPIFSTYRNPHSALRISSSSMIGCAIVGRKRGSAGRLAQLFVKRTQALRNNPRAANHRHEIMVPSPPPPDLQMQLRLCPGSGCGTEIPSDVEGFGLPPLTQKTLRVN